MINLENDIISSINDFEYFSFLNVKAIKPYAFKSNELTTPLVIVQRIYSSPNQKTFTSKEEYEDFGFQITVLSRLQKNLINDTIPAYDVVSALSEEIVKLLYDNFLMVRQGDVSIRPLSDDNTVMMCVFRVNGTIDLTHNYLYTR